MREYNIFIDISKLLKNLFSPNRSSCNIDDIFFKDIDK